MTRGQIALGIYLSIASIGLVVAGIAFVVAAHPRVWQVPIGTAAIIVGVGVLIFVGVRLRRAMRR